MKKACVLLITVTVLLVFLSAANASLTAIGTASYGRNDYNLIYEDDSIYGGLVWLDYVQGNDTWQNQVDWASELGNVMTVSLSPGYTSTIDWTTGWRLPLAGDDPQSGYDDSCLSELGHLYYDSLGKSAGTVGPVVSELPFTMLETAFYWTGTEYSADPNIAWMFAFNTGSLGHYNKVNPYSALAVRPGDVSAVPIPAAAWLLGSGLIGLIGTRRKFQK